MFTGPWTYLIGPMFGWEVGREGRPNLFPACAPLVYIFHSVTIEKRYGKYKLLRNLPLHIHYGKKAEMNSSD